MLQANLNIEKYYRMLIIIWAALLVSQVLFLVVLYFSKPEIFRFDFTKPLLGGDETTIILVLAFIGISSFLMSFILRSKFIRQAIDKQNPLLVQTALVVGCALCEAVTLLGFVLAFAFGYQYFFLWFALGILGIILHFPKRDNLIAASYKKM
ncbi:MAG: hypothetical protein ACR2LT_06480 [Pyrinomonadaceae bacterium]